MIHPSSWGEHRGGPAPATASAPKEREKLAASAGCRARSKDVLAGKKAVPRLPAAEEQSKQGIKQLDRLLFSSLL